MNLNVYRSEPLLATRELLFVGFEGDFDENICNFPYQSETYQFAIENNPVNALQWLERRIEQIEVFQLPYAVFCKLSWLQKENFLLARQIAENPFLRYTPVIALCEHGVHVDKTTLSRHGIDDCYSIPVEWDMLEKRLEFLNEYKPLMINPSRQATAPPKGFQYKIPRSKRIFDILSASLGILLSSALWVLIALAIRIESKGPVIYKSKRVGTGYRVFDFLKFRSMYIDAEQRLEELKYLNLYDDREDPVFVKLSHDPRVTRVGRFIRKFSLDELPQFINVLRGDMSLVGNRPLPLYEAEMLVKEDSCERFLAPAGLTGLWQVTKRGNTQMSTDERIALDIAYSRQYNLLFDLKIIARTFRAVMQHENV